MQRNKKTGKPNGRIQFRSDALRAAQRRRHEQSDEFRDRYRWRSGIEATNSCLKRALRMARLRVRGKSAVKTAILLKLAGWNILRAVAMRTSRRASGKLATQLAS
ncbi:MAG: transposase [Planctomycetota bacterium]